MGTHPTRKARPARRRPGPTRPRRLGPWKHGAVPVVGLIGGIGAGKSLVAARLAARGAKVIDADAVGHALLDQRPARDQVVARFGEEVRDPNDPERIDRRALGRIVFADPDSLRALEAILHPRMRRTFEKVIARAQRRREDRAVVLDAAVLLEAGWDDLCDLVAFVDAPREVRLARLAAGRGWSPEMLEARERAQRPLDEKRGRAELVLTNGAGPEDLECEVGHLWDRLKVLPRPRFEPVGGGPRSAPGPTTSRPRPRRRPT